MKYTYSPDVQDQLVALVDRPDEWAATREKIISSGGWLQIMNEQVRADAAQSAETGNVGANNYPALLAADFFRRLKALGVKLAMGGPLAKDWSCDGKAAAWANAMAMDRVRAAGHEISMFAGDEPLARWGVRDPCRQRPDPPEAKWGDGPEAAVGPTKVVMDAIRDAGLPRDEHGRPDIRIVTCYPDTPMDDLIALVGGLQQSGPQPAGIDLDFDVWATSFHDKPRFPWEKDAWHRMEDRHAAELRRLQAACTSWGIPLSVIIHGQRGETPETYHDEALEWARWSLRLLGRAPDDVTVNSWKGKPGGLPVSLPESDPLSHTGLFLETVRLMEAA